MARRRLDSEIVRRGLAENQQDAQLLIDNHEILVAGVFADKPNRFVGADEPIELISKSRFVGRGGEKLQGALKAFNISVKDKHIVDVGSSTGGFTDCCLQNGASHVTAIDVGTNQLHEKLRNDSRVSVHEKTNVRDVVWNDLLVEPADLVVIDVSFISLTSITSKLGELGVDTIALIKPQFEATAQEASRGAGIITDPAIWDRAISGVVLAFGEYGFELADLINSPIRGTEGNVEFLALFAPRGTKAAVDSDSLRAKVVKTAYEPRE